MYKVPMKIPKCCNKCPFGMCDFSHPFGCGEISRIDGKENKTGYYGYVCNIEFLKNNKYTKINRSKIDEDIKKPKWCGLINLEETKDKERTRKNVAPIKNTKGIL